MKSQLEKLDSIHPDLISAFLTNGDCDGIPQDVKLFLQQLQWSAEIFEHERNITRAAKSALVWRESIRQSTTSKLIAMFR